MAQYYNAGESTGPFKPLYSNKTTNTEYSRTGYTLYTNTTAKHTIGFKVTGAVQTPRNATWNYTWDSVLGEGCDLSVVTIEFDCRVNEKPVDTAMFNFAGVFCNLRAANSMNKLLHFTATMDSVEGTRSYSIEDVKSGEIISESSDSGYSGNPECAWQLGYGNVWLSNISINTPAAAVEILTGDTVRIKQTAGKMQADSLRAFSGGGFRMAFDIGKFLHDKGFVEYISPANAPTNEDGWWQGTNATSNWEYSFSQLQNTGVGGARHVWNFKDVGLPEKTKKIIFDYTVYYKTSRATGSCLGLCGQYSFIRTDFPGTVVRSRQILDVDDANITEELYTQTDTGEWESVKSNTWAKGADWYCILTPTPTETFFKDATLTVESDEPILIDGVLQSDTMRRLLAGEVLSADVARVLDVSGTLEGDTRRNLAGANSIRAATIRELVANGQMGADTSRRLISPGRFSAETARELLVSGQIDGDTKRIFNFEPYRDTLSGDTVRYLSAPEVPQGITSLRALSMRGHLISQFQWR